MTDPEIVIALLNHRKTRILQYAESSLHPGQFKAFRKLVLDDLGMNGLEGEIRELANGTDRNGPE